MLDIKNVSDSVHRALRESEFTQVDLGIGSTDTQAGHGGIRSGTLALVVSESGLYGLCMSSRKPEAKAFKRWVRTSPGF
jgi:prophage antirepressor-like protein